MTTRLTTGLSIVKLFRDNSTMPYPFFNEITSFFRRALLMSLVIGLIWLPGLALAPLRAESIVTTAVVEEMDSQGIDSAAARGDRMIAFLACLPKQLSQPSLKRAWEEMKNDQLERILDLKANPKLSLAETEMQSCMSRKGFTI